MSILSLLFIAIALAMDAFVVAISTGLCSQKITYIKAILLALVFGFFQSIMPLIGFVGGKFVESLIRPYDHWIIFIILAVLGIRMIREWLEKNKNCETKNYFTFKNLVIMGIATSLDALAVGIWFSLLDFNIFLAVVIIGIITAILCFFGVIFGKKIGNVLGHRAEIFGWMVLILIGTKILIEHLFF